MTLWAVSQVENVTSYCSYIAALFSVVVFVCEISTKELLRLLSSRLLILQRSLLTERAESDYNRVTCERLEWEEAWVDNAS